MTLHLGRHWKRLGAQQPGRSGPVARLNPVPCALRGPVAGQVSCCGSPSVYACSRHRQCVLTRQQWDAARSAASSTTSKPPKCCELCRDVDVGPNTPVTIAIPVRSEIELLAASLRLHRAQVGITPRFVLVDTGTVADELDHLHRLAESPDVLLLSDVRDHWDHPSDPVCAAMELAQQHAHADYMLATHSDCIPCARHSVLDMLNRCNSQTPAVGYQMSPRRDHDVWDYRRMLSHTFTMFHLPTCRAAGMRWDMRPACAATGTMDEYVSETRVNWPDTECGFNWWLWQAGLTPESRRIQIIGREENFTFDKTAHYWHVRSLVGSRLYEPHHYAKACRWKQEALRQATEWEQVWTRS